jgi:integrase
MTTPKRRTKSYETRPAEHIERRRKRYFVVMNVPTDVRDAFGGKKRLTRTLGTDSLEVAKRAAQPFIIAWQNQIAKAKKDNPNSWRSKMAGKLRMTEAELAAFVESVRGQIVERVELGGADYTVVERNGQILPGALIEETAEEFAPDESAVLTFRDGKSVKVRGGKAGASGGKFANWIDEWIAGKTFAAKSKDMALSDVRAFAVEFPNLGDVTRPEVKRWADALVANSTIKTVSRKLWALRSYWEYLQAIEEVPSESLPFWNLALGKQRGRAKKGSKVRPFKTADVLKLLGEANKEGDQELRDLIFCDMWSGARIEEWCSLRIQEIHLTADHPHYVPDEGKTGAAIREVPIHPKLMPVLCRMIGKRANGYLFPNLSANKFGDRSNAIGKRFGRLKTRLGFEADSQVFHSIRHTVSALYKAAGVEESVAADIIGHDHGTMTYSVYAGHADLATKADAVAKLSYAPKKTKAARIAAAAE